MLPYDTCGLCCFSHKSCPPISSGCSRSFICHAWSTLLHSVDDLNLFHLPSVSIRSFITIYHSHPYNNTFGRAIIILADKYEERRLRQLIFRPQPITQQERLDRKYPLSRNNTQHSKKSYLLSIALVHSGSQGMQRPGRFASMWTTWRVLSPVSSLRDPLGLRGRHPVHSSAQSCCPCFPTGLFLASTVPSILHESQHVSPGSLDSAATVLEFGLIHFLLVLTPCSLHLCSYHLPTSVILCIYLFLPLSPGHTRHANRDCFVPYGVPHS